MYIYKLLSPSAADTGLGSKGLCHPTWLSVSGGSVRQSLRIPGWWNDHHLETSGCLVRRQRKSLGHLPGKLNDLARMWHSALYICSQLKLFVWSHSPTKELRKQFSTCQEGVEPKFFGKEHEWVLWGTIKVRYWFRVQNRHKLASDTIF